MLLARVGRFTQPAVTGAVPITGVGFRPSVILFFLSDRSVDGAGSSHRHCVGVATDGKGSSAVSSAADHGGAASNTAQGLTTTSCFQVVDGSGTVVTQATLQSMDADGFTVDVNPAGAARIVNFLALGGPDMPLFKVGNFTAAAAIGAQAIMGVGFRPDFVMFLANSGGTGAHGNLALGFMRGATQRATIAGSSTDAANPTNARCYQRTDRALAILQNQTDGISNEGDFQSFDEDGFTVSWSIASARSIAYLAWKGPLVWIGSAAQPAAAGNQPLRGLGFTPAALIAFSHCFAASQAVQTAGSRFAFGAASAAMTQEGCIFAGDRDAVTPANVSQSLSGTALLQCYTEGGASPTLNAQLDGAVSIDFEGVTGQWSAPDATAREVIYVALGPRPNTLTIQANPLLIRPAARLLIELELGGTPLRVSTEDLYPVALGGMLYEKRLHAEPELTFGAPDQFGGVQEIEQIDFVLSNADGRLNEFFYSEKREARVRVHLFDKETAAVTQDYFVGKLAAFSFTLHAVSINATSVLLSKLAEMLPSRRVSLADFPKAQDVGAVIPYGWGVGRRVPGRYVKARLAQGDDNHWDYALGVGNLGVDMVYVAGKQFDVLSPATEYAVIHDAVAVAGARVTLIRFRKRQASALSPGSLLPITANVQRVYPDFDPTGTPILGEWKWTQSLGFRDCTSFARHCTGFGGVGTAALVAGPTTVGLGAVALDGVDDYLSVGGTSTILAQTFTLEAWIYPIAAVTRDWIVGPRTTRGATHTNGWRLTYDSANGRFTFTAIRDDTGAAHSVSTANGSAASLSTWYHILITRDRTTGNTSIYLNGTLAATANLIVDLRYSAGTELMEFARSQSTATVYAQGRLGFVRLADKARDARYARRSWWLMRRNPVEFLQDIFVGELGETIDQTAFDTAATDVDNVPGVGAGQLRCDGYATEETEARDLIGAVTVFRDLVLGRNLTGLTMSAAKAATAVQAQFGVGMAEQFGNIEEMSGRTLASLAEAIRTLPVKYRPRRDDAGVLGDDFEHTINGDVGTVGRVSDALALPFVYDHTTGDIVRDFQRKRMKLRAELLRLGVGHEGRLLRAGHVVRVHAADMGLYGRDYEVLVAVNQVRRFTYSLVPYDERVFTYEPAASLPADRIADDIAFTLGNAATIQLESAGGTAPNLFLKLKVRFRSRELLSPTALGAANDWTFGGSGAPADHVDAVNDPPPPAASDGDASYIQRGVDATGNRDILFVFQRPTAFLGIVEGVLVAATGRTITGPIVNVNRIVRGADGVIYQIRGSGSGNASDLDFNVASASFSDYDSAISGMALGSPITGERWTLADINSLQFGLRLTPATDPDQAPAGDTVRVTRIWMEYQTLNDPPVDFAAVRIWRRTTGALPTEDEEPDFFGAGLTYIDGPLAAGTYYYTARAYDSVGRIAGVIGPVAATLV